jgi:hypothetical protein
MRFECSISELTQRLSFQQQIIQNKFVYRFRWIKLSIFPTFQSVGESSEPGKSRKSIKHFIQTFDHQGQCRFIESSNSNVVVTSTICQLPSTWNLTNCHRRLNLFCVKQLNHPVQFCDHVEITLEQLFRYMVTLLSEDLVSNDINLLVF